MFCYSNDGQSFVSVDANYVPKAGERVFPDYATPGQLAAAFPGYGEAEQEKAWKAVRKERDRLLRQSDWTQTADAPLTAETVDAWRSYRQALRDVPQAFSAPASVVWPAAPGSN